MRSLAPAEPAAPRGAALAPVGGQAVDGLRRAAGNRAFGALVTGARLARFGLLSVPVTPPPNASEAYQQAAKRIDVVRTEYAERQTSANGQGSIIEWLDNLAGIARGWEQGENATDARALFGQLGADIGKTREEWAAKENALLKAFKENIGKLGKAAKENADNRDALMKIWLAVRHDARLDKSGARRALTTATRDQILALYRRLRTAVSHMLGEFASAKHQKRTLAEVRADLLARTNEYRRTGGTSNVAQAPLALDDKLNGAAQMHAVYLATEGAVFSHTGEGGSGPSQRIREHGYHWRASAENIAYNQGTPAAAIAGWIKSPGHEKNLVKSDVRHVGFGYAVNAKGEHLWVQVFADPWG